MPTSSARNVLILALGQALMLSAIVLSMTLAAILGSALAPDKGLATLPVAAMVVGAALASLPAARLMRRAGRRPASCSARCWDRRQPAVRAGAAPGQLRGFVVGHTLIGSYQGFATTTALPQSEAASAGQASRAISLVVAGGLVAAFLGPQLAQWGVTGSPASCSSGSYLAQGALS